MLANPVICCGEDAGDRQLSMAVSSNFGDPLVPYSALSCFPLIPFEHYRPLSTKSSLYRSNAPFAAS